MATIPAPAASCWKVYHGSHTSASRPVFAQGLVMFVTGMGKPELWAVKPDGQGDCDQARTWFGKQQQSGFQDSLPPWRWGSCVHGQ